MTMFRFPVSLVIPPNRGKRKLKFVVSATKLNAKFENGKIEIKTRLIIGSDGPASRVARDAGLSTKREVLAAFGADVEGYQGRDNHVDLFVGSELAPRFFGWGIPTGPNEGRIGMATVLPNRPKNFFRNFIPFFT